MDLKDFYIQIFLVLITFWSLNSCIQLPAWWQASHNEYGQSTVLGKAFSSLFILCSFLLPWILQACTLLLQKKNPCLLLSSKSYYASAVLFSPSPDLALNFIHFFPVQLLCSGLALQSPQDYSSFLTGSSLHFQTNLHTANRWSFGEVNP